MQKQLYAHCWYVIPPNLEKKKKIPLKSKEMTIYFKKSHCETSGFSEKTQIFMKYFLICVTHCVTYSDSVFTKYPLI